MTNREFFTAIVTLVNEGIDAIDATVLQDIEAHATKEIEKLDDRNARRSSKPTKTQIEKEAIKKEIIKFLATCETGTTATTIANGVGISVQKASALCRQMVEDGRLTVEDIKVPKKGKQKAFTTVAAEGMNEVETN